MVARGNRKTKKKFKPLPWQVAPWKDKSDIILLTGSAGGGKSHLALEKMNAFCLKYPGAFCMIIRKTRSSMTSGAALFYEQEIIINKQDDPKNGVKHLENKSRFDYANGSKVVYMGMNDPRAREKLKSIGATGGVDMAFLEEATELDEKDMNAIKGRMRGRAANWSQIIVSCNPDAPTHWIYTQLIKGGQASVHYSRAADNTHNPEKYLRTLASMTGVDKLRLADGMWVQATGLVYEMWRDHPGQIKEVLDEDENPTGIFDAGNVTEEADYIPDNGPIYWAVDDGYSAGSKYPDGIDPISETFTADSHPRVILLAQLKADGHLDIFAESYMCKTLPEAQIREVFELGYPMPSFATVDGSAAQLRGRIQKGQEYQADSGSIVKIPGVYTRNGTHKVAEGIKEVRRWIEADENGFRKLRIHPRCTHFRSEMLSYSNDDKKGEPKKEFDHGPDSIRYKIWKLRHNG